MNFMDTGWPVHHNIENNPFLRENMAPSSAFERLVKSNRKNTNFQPGPFKNFVQYSASAQQNPELSRRNTEKMHEIVNSLSGAAQKEIITDLLHKMQKNASPEYTAELAKTEQFIQAGNFPEARATLRRLLFSWDISLKQRVTTIDTAPI